MERFYTLLQTPAFWLLSALSVTALFLLYYGYRRLKLAALENVS